MVTETLTALTNAVERMTTDVLVIGGGQAALAMGYHLRQQPYGFEIVERHAHVGDSWRTRYDSLVLFTPRAYSALPGLPVPGDPETYPTKDEVADYLEVYASHFALPVRLGTGIASLRRTPDGFEATTDDGRILASRAVILANGAFQTPAVPAFAKGLSADVVQLTAATYHRPSDVPAGTVAIVGDGATGRQIALDLAATHRTLLSGGRPRRVGPERILGKSAFWWMEKLGLLAASRDAMVGKYMRRTDPFPGKHLELANLVKHGIESVPRVMAADGRGVTFGDGRAVEVSAVIWASGYRENTTWVDIPEAKDGEGLFSHTRGLTPVSGLYVIGRTWQWSRGSALFYGVGNDARYLMPDLNRHLGAAR
jgi:putative flavoprotein involved in K+ transport